MVYFLLYFMHNLESVISLIHVCFHNFTSIFQSSQPHFFFFSLVKHFFYPPPPKTFLLICFTPFFFFFALLFLLLLLLFFFFKSIEEDKPTKNSSWDFFFLNEKWSFWGWIYGLHYATARVISNVSLG